MADFAARYLSELESGKGFGAAGKAAGAGAIGGIKKSFSKEAIVRAAFGGDDMLSAYARGRFGVKKKEEKERKPTKFVEGLTGGMSLDGSNFLKIIAKESMAIPAMARDTNVLRQNLQKLVKIWGGTAATKKEKDEGKEERKQDISYFAEQDKKEAELEAQRGQVGGQAATTPTPEKKEGEGGFLDSIMSLFADGFMSGIKKLFSPKMLGSILKKVFLPIAIIGTLFSGITDGFKKYQETGSFSEAIVAGLGGMLKFLTFGLFDADSLKSLWEAVSNFLSPITDTISNIFTGIKDFFKKMFGMGGEEDKSKDKIPKVTPQQPDASKFAAGAAKASGASDEKAADLGNLFGSVQKGDIGGLFGKAQEFAKKYPEAPATETSPAPMTGEGIPLDQAQRNYELNKKLTGEASKALGTPLPFNEPAPTAAQTSAPTPTPTPAPIPKETATGGAPIGDPALGSKRTVAFYENAVAQREKQLANPNLSPEQRSRAEEMLAKNRQKLEQAKADLAASEGGATVSAAGGGGATASAVSGGGGSAGGASAGGGGGSSDASVSGGGSTPSVDSGGGPSVSGSEVSSASSAVAEGQRMESAADQGSVINAPTTNNSASSQGNAKPPTAETYDTNLAKMLMTT